MTFEMTVPDEIRGFYIPDLSIRVVGVNFGQPLLEFAFGKAGMVEDRIRPSWPMIQFNFVAEGPFDVTQPCVDNRMSNVPTDGSLYAWNQREGGSGETGTNTCRLTAIFFVLDDPPNLSVTIRNSRSRWGGPAI